MKILLWVLMGLGGLLLFLLLLLAICLLLPARVRVMLRQDRFFLWVGLGPIRIRLLPWKEKKEKKQKKQKKATKAERKKSEGSAPPSSPSFPIPSASPETPGTGSSSGAALRVSETGKAQGKWGGAGKLDIPYLLDLIRLGLSAMERFRRAIRVDHFLLESAIATGDAAKTAMAYGAAAAGVGTFLPLLEESLRVRKKDIQVTCDFEGQESRIFFDIQVSALVFQLLMIGIKVLRGFLQLRKQHDQEEVSV